MRARKTKKKLDITKLKVKWTYILFSIIAFSCYIFVFQSHHYHKWFVFVTSFIGLLSIAMLQYMWFEVLPKSKWNKAANAMILVILTSPVVLILICLHETYYNNQLEHYGTIVYGKVTDTYSTNGRGGIHYTAVFRYMLHGKEWVQEVGNDHFLFKEQDSLKILCSSEEPEIFSILNVLPIDSMPPTERKHTLTGICVKERTDTAFIKYDLESEQNGTYDIKNNEVEIGFTSNISSIHIQPTNGVYLEVTKDINLDGKNEILIYSSWPHGNWNDLFVYSLVNNQWQILGKCRAFVSNEKDSVDRIEIDKAKKTYLIGDEVNDEGEFVIKRILLKN